jgi:hypothetical protein
MAKFFLDFDYAFFWILIMIFMDFDYTFFGFYSTKASLILADQFFIFSYLNPPQIYFTKCILFIMPIINNFKLYLKH